MTLLFLRVRLAQWSCYVIVALPSHHKLYSGVFPSVHAPLTISKGFKKAVTLHAESAINEVEQSMYEIYEKNNHIIEGKLQELTEVLGRIGLCCTYHRHAGILPVSF